MGVILIAYVQYSKCIWVVRKGNKHMQHPFFSRHMSVLFKLNSSIHLNFFKLIFKLTFYQDFELRKSRYNLIITNRKKILDISIDTTWNSPQMQVHQSKRNIGSSIRWREMELMQKKNLKNSIKWILNTIFSRKNMIRCIFSKRLMNSRI